jgi:hypothetical protein
VAGADESDALLLAFAQFVVQHSCDMRSQEAVLQPDLIDGGRDLYCTFEPDNTVSRTTLPVRHVSVSSWWNANLLVEYYRNVWFDLVDW